jgi:hypothetical protein
VLLKPESAHSALEAAAVEAKGGGGCGSTRGDSQERGPEPQSLASGTLLVLGTSKGDGNGRGAHT